MRARRGRSAEIAGVTAEEADHINGYCAIPGFGWGIFWKEGVRGRLSSGSCRARVVHGAAGSGSRRFEAEQRRGCHGGEEGAARWGQPISERGDMHADRAGRWGEGVRSDGPNGEKGSSWAALGHAGGKGGGTAWAVRSLGWAGLG